VIETLAVRPRRRTELGLIVLVALITVSAYILASLGRTSEMPANVGPFLAIILGLMLVGHVALRLWAPTADSILLPMAGLLNGLGYVFIARLDHRLAGLQATWTVLGMGAFVVTIFTVRRARDLERYRYTLAFAGVALLLLPLVPHIGRNINGARLWVRVGSITFQPGELAKLALAVYFASYLVDKRELLSRPTWRVGRFLLPDPKHLGPIVLAWAASLLVLFSENDLGTSFLFFALFIVMLWVATGRGAYLGVGLTLFAAGAALAYKTFAHARTRIQVWLNPGPHAQTTGYQVIQGLYAMGSGGLTGSGLGLGSPTRIPEVATDFIFAAIGEELGLLGTAAVVLAFVIMVGTGLRIALRAEREFDKLLATGLTFTLGLQAFIIMAGVTRLAPLTGITLPFISYGGSSLIANYILLALLLRISTNT
jgi:peptidoglycan glycosyltransferase